ncbi:hypothetical protein P153DRAFT_387328 [Dothidotthia symphoricarpi CBS 119687]|uniref:Uncharacterized protein n=1 Tax=Dothidotthia symphoricarpi CBS 119687 TaxID=1392245 RepID=A0A6A6A7Q2_9PLEO|nr:uncharacterized protein P153DRAFT_387328 [Dothidotthia symphoricarpi CBS 119687]KAF2127586.1 hypothetical protein P153DRAFT_387328 [Dothidotthia symphoricarpi CBS 119687]
MSETTSFDEDIYTGVWINRSYGTLQGSTLTLDRQRGSILIAFLALFVGATGRSFWKIVRYWIHVAVSTEARSDGVYHQRQALLRNSQLAQDAAINFFLAHLVWRSRVEHAGRKLLPVALAAFVVSGAFSLAGIFSSKVVANAANEVLLSGSNCGNMTHTQVSDTGAAANIWTEYFSSLNQKASEYLTYAHKCYQNQTGSVSKDCGIYVKASLPYTKDASAGCPFDAEMCTLPQGNLILDSGYLDSYKDFGLNSGPQFLFRLKRHCAPLETDGYSEAFTDQSDPPLQWMRYYYGTSLGGLQPYTYRIRTNVTEPTIDVDALFSEADYKITSPNSFSPISQLNKTNTVVQLMFLESTDVKYYAEVTDPWFLADSPKQVPAWLDLKLELANNTYFATNRSAGVLACASTTEYCNPNLPSGRRCFNHGYDHGFWNEVWPNADDRAFVNGLLNYFGFLYGNTIYTPNGYYDIRGLPSLLTRFTLNGPMQPATIPSNRWQEETEFIFQTNLAAAQARVVEYANGKQSKTLESVVTYCGNGTECTRLCHSQKIKSPGYYSFSVLSLSLVLIIGTLIVLVGTFIEAIIDLASKIPRLSRDRKLTYARAEWQVNSTLQLQRLAHEGIGLGTWSRGAESVPVTQRGELLAALDIKDADHPCLAVDRELEPAYTSSRVTTVKEDEIATPQPYQAVFGANTKPRYKRLPSADQS